MTEKGRATYGRTLTKRKLALASCNPGMPESRVSTFSRPLKLNTSSRNWRRGTRVLLFCILVFSLSIPFHGCAKFAIQRHSLDQKRYERFYTDELEMSRNTDLTNLILRAYGLDEKKGGTETLAALLEAIERNPKAELIAAFVELAYKEGQRQEKTAPGQAAQAYVAGALQAYSYLFDPCYTADRNPYDTRFHNVHQVYNRSLERLLRLLGDDENKLRLRPGDEFHVATSDNRWNAQCRLVTRNWRPDEIDYFTFARDFKLVNIDYAYRQGGLGVPLIAHRKTGDAPRDTDKYYPLGLCFPVTAFLRPNEIGQSSPGCQAVLELYDPLESAMTTVDGVPVPLETDLTTPLGCFLANPAAQLIPTVGLVRPDDLLKTLPVSDGNGKEERSIKGLYLMEPYDPNRIPVVLVHGLWSSPLTWMEMFNQLRSLEDIRDRYQFWFYFYPSGQPFWVSAAQLRDDLEEIRATLDPERRIATLDEMVLVGHSMGGLIARMQVIDSEDYFWRLVSDEPFDDVDVSSATRDELGKWFFFKPNPSIRRIVTIATPFEGSRASNNVSQWLATKLIAMPATLGSVAGSFFETNEVKSKKGSLLKVKTSVESLAPECPVFAAMDESPLSDRVVWNNIVGVSRENKKWNGETKPGDGIVDYASAHRADAASETVVASDHMHVHLHPAAIRETRRVLMQHFDQMTAERNRERVAALPVQGTGTALYK